MQLIVNTNTPLRGYLAGEIRAEVARQQYSKSAIAAALGVVPATLSRKLSGEQPFHTEELDAISSMLDVDPSELVARAEQRRERETQEQAADWRSRLPDA